MLSVDFLAGFTIFIVALIMVINLVPSILVGIQGQPIDYDAVAYRTAVILLEDPGWGYDRNANTSTSRWEQQITFKADISRFGLAVSKETPNILSRNKIDTFFDDTYFTREDYERKAIFADLPYAPYAYNITLSVDGDPTITTGDPVPKVSYGYMRRFVKLKEHTSMVIDSGGYNAAVRTNETNPPSNTLNHTARMSVFFNYTELNDLTVGNAYDINPYTDNVTIIVGGFKTALQSLGPPLIPLGDFVNMTQVTLTSVSLSKWNVPSAGSIPPSWLSVDGALQNYRLYNETTADLHSRDDPFPVLNSSEIGLELLPPLPFAEDPDARICVNFTFRYEWSSNDTADGNHHFLFNDDTFEYNLGTVTSPPLRDGVLEVAVW
ncbi:MAG: hypothetical protein JXA08_05665 [Methanomicrobiaceae archaeon]|nr:hypothetical protein [Methanomicrobiaceae archaeon]